MKCEKCSEEHDGTYGSGRFCKQECARSFSSMEKRAEINKKVSLKLKGKSNGGHGTFTPEQRLRGSLKSREIIKAKHILKMNTEPFETLSGKYKRKKILIEQDNRCNRCGISVWFGKAITFQYHHKDGDRNNNKRGNVEMLCPNCHSQTDNFCFKGRTHTNEVKIKCIAGARKKHNMPM